MQEIQFTEKLLANLHVSIGGASKARSKERMEQFGRYCNRMKLVKAQQKKIDKLIALSQRIVATKTNGQAAKSSTVKNKERKKTEQKKRLCKKLQTNDVSQR